MTNTSEGTRIWRNKIQGLRDKVTGLIFSNFERSKYVITVEQAKASVKDPNNDHRTEWFMYFSTGLDTAYSQGSPDTISMSFVGVANKGTCIVLDKKVYDSAVLGAPLTPTDTIRNSIDFLEHNRQEWGFTRDTFIDSVDQTMITEFLGYKRLNGCICNFSDAWKRGQIIDRINNQLNWFAGAGSQSCFYIVDTYKNYIRELGVYSWLRDKDNTPEDKNDHMVNSMQYA